MTVVLRKTESTIDSDIVVVLENRSNLWMDPHFAKAHHTQFIADCARKVIRENPGISIRDFYTEVSDAVAAFYEKECLAGRIYVATRTSLTISAMFLLNDPYVEVTLHSKSLGRHLELVA